MIGLAWRCELPLWKTFWLLHCLGTAVVAATVFGLMYVMLTLVTIFYPIPIEAYVFEITSYIIIVSAMLWNWISMGLVWFNAGNTSSLIWRVLAQLYVVVNVMNVVYTAFKLTFAL